jgi:hypothetical protein
MMVKMYSFDDYDRPVVARLYRLASGRYRVAVRADEDNDGIYEKIFAENELYIRRFDTLPIQVPPKVPSVLTITQIEAESTASDLPDLATSPYFLKKEGKTLTVTVFNIGCAPSGPFTVSLIGHDGAVLMEKRLESLDGSGDYVAKFADVTFTGVPASPRYSVYIDREKTIREIYKGNNLAEWSDMLNK